MTIDTASGRTGTRKAPARRTKPRPAIVLEPLVIGESDRNIFNCPVCSRPLAVGATRCPGCRTRLILSTPAKRVTIFMLVGVVVGLVLSWGISAGFAAAGALLQPADPAASPIVRASGGILPSAVPSGPVVATIPPIARSALGQTAVLNNRLGEGAAALRAALKDRDLDSAAVADTLRSLAADASFGEGLAPRLGTWDQASEVALGLGSLYTAVRGTAVDGLNASITNDPAYRTAAQRMLVVLSGVAPLDARVRTLAAIVGVNMPPPSTFGTAAKP